MRITRFAGMKRCYDFFCALLGLIFLSPVFFFISVLIKIESKGPIFYKQVRVGQYNKDFWLFKFRTMHVDADRVSRLTTKNISNKITRVGKWLRKYKLDELPQLYNVLKGEMSLVGPRPEVREFVNLYTNEQKKVLELKPGITDLASIQYSNEAEILNNLENPEQYYKEVLMPEKIKINLNSRAMSQSVIGSTKIIFKTFLKVFV